MSIKANIEKAKAAVGFQPSTGKASYQFGRRTTHIADLKVADAAGTRPLIAILESAAVVSLYDLRDARAAMARRHQDKDNRAGWRIGAALFVTVLLAVATVFMTGDERPWWKLAVTFAIYVLLIYAVARMIYIRRNDDIGVWFANRGEAEELRRRYFEAIIDAPVEAAPGDLPATLLKLEYFRRYQLDLQTNYYREKGLEHRGKVNGVNCLLFGFAFAVFGLFMVLVLVVVGAGSEVWDWSLGFAWVEAGLGRLLHIEAWHLDRWALIATIAIGLIYLLLHVYVRLAGMKRNAKRYGESRRNLAFVRAGSGDKTHSLEALRQRAADPADEEALAAVRAFARRVHGVMQNEHAEWVRLQALEQDIRAAVGDGGTPAH